MNVDTQNYPEHDGVAHNGGDQDEGEAASPDDLVHCPGGDRLTASRNGKLYFLY